MSKSYGHLVPSVERRLSTWVSLSATRRPQPPRRRPSLTISRRFGCEAYPLAEHLKDLLDAATAETWVIYDKALLEQVSRDEDLSLKLFEDLGGPSRAIDSIGFLFAGHLSQDLIYRRMVRHIVRIAETGHAIIVGRGGAILTQNLANCFHFRLEASMAFRVASIVRRLQVSEREAERLVRDGERMREKFIENCLGASLSDPMLYDAVFNNARQGVAAIARSIVAYVAETWPDREYFRIATAV